MASIWLFLQQAALPGKSKQRLSTNPLCPQRHLPLDYRIWEKNIKTQWILKKKEIRAKKVRRRGWRQALGEAELFGRTYTALRQREGSKDKWWPKNGLSLPIWSLLNPLADSNQRLSATLVVVSDNKLVDSGQLLLRKFLPCRSSLCHLAPHCQRSWKASSIFLPSHLRLCWHRAGGPEEGSTNTCSSFPVDKPRAQLLQCQPVQLF